MKRFHLIPLIAAAVWLDARADTVVMKTLEVIEGKPVGGNADYLELQVEFGTMRIPRDKILRIDEDTPEILADRKAKEASEKELTDKMLAEGKVRYKGKWVTAEEKKASEAKIAAEKKAIEDEKKKKQAELAAKKAEELKAKLAEQAALLKAEKAAALLKQQEAQTIRNAANTINNLNGQYQNQYNRR